MDTASETNIFDTYTTSMVQCRSNKERRKWLHKHLRSLKCFFPYVFISSEFNKFIKTLVLFFEARSSLKTHYTQTLVIILYIAENMGGIRLIPSNDRSRIKVQNLEVTSEALKDTHNMLTLVQAGYDTKEISTLISQMLKSIQTMNKTCNSKLHRMRKTNKPKDSVSEPLLPVWN